jgi:hypothetical protein
MKHRSERVGRSQQKVYRSADMTRRLALKD